MKTEKFKNLFGFGPKSNIKAGDGSDKGRFPFYTSSPKQTKWIDRNHHFEEALIFGTGGLASVHFEDQPFSTSTDCIVAITTNKEIKTKFVYYYLSGNIHLLERGFKGAGLKHISKRYIENLDIPILPVETQNKVVAILDKASSLILKREECISLIDKILYSTFNEIFGDIVNNPKGWPVKNLEKSVLIMRDGPFGSNLKTEHYTEDGIRIIRLQNIEPNVFNDSNKEFVSEVHAETLKKHICLPGDVLVGTLGEPNLRACKFPANLFNKAINKADCIQIRPDTKIAIASYISYMLNHPGALFFVSNYIKGQTRTRISKGMLSRIDVPIPPIELQKRFELIESKFEDLRNKLLSTDLSNLNQSLIQKVFNGQLNFNVDYELDNLINEIDLQKKENKEFSELEDNGTKLNASDQIRLNEAYNQGREHGKQNAKYDLRSVLGKVKNMAFNEREGNAVFKKVFSKKLKGFGFDEFEAFIKSEGFTYEYHQLKDFIFDKLENNELVQYYSNNDWRDLNYKKESSPFQDDFAGDGKIFLVPNISKK